MDGRDELLFDFLFIMFVFCFCFSFFVIIIECQSIKYSIVTKSRGPFHIWNSSSRKMPVSTSISLKGKQVIQHIITVYIPPNIDLTSSIESAWNISGISLINSYYRLKLKSSFVEETSSSYNWDTNYSNYCLS